MRLIINIPAYNEEEKIRETIKRIPRQFEGIDEVFLQVVDDGSSDNTAKAAKEAGADFVLLHGINRRLGVMFATASENALKEGADIMVNIDADGQFDPHEISKLLHPILTNQADMVVGDRFSQSTAKNIPWIKDFFNRLGASLVGSFLNIKTNDLTCGFRAHNRETLLRLNNPSGFTYTQETIIDAIGKNLRVMWIPVQVTYFANRKSKIVKSVYSFVNNSARIILKAVRDVRPLKFFGIPGLILIAISLGLFCIFLAHYFQDFKITPYRNYLLSSLATFVIGLQFFVFALIADMIKTNRRLTEDMIYLFKKEKYK
ncbi:MAG: glycosyltransferase family 2 protein [Candidatus Moranbacteria bacterium]|jgi:glycosyltransferase involved in cell wall biosynthesis|nr:glycosyltransferase family 2 protein [Candidatus Moranbacteria bacterium]MBP9801469.1 glycosyltransferase family 2 protein [Candidatus Moranbacteria bacterium]